MERRGEALLFQGIVNIPERKKKLGYRILNFDLKNMIVLPVNLSVTITAQNIATEIYVLIQYQKQQNKNFHFTINLMLTYFYCKVCAILRAMQLLLRIMKKSLYSESCFGHDHYNQHMVLCSVP